MYGLGTTVRGIQGHLHKMYGVEVSSDLISEVTDSIQEEVKAWQDRPLEAIHPIIHLDALVVRLRQDGKVDNRGDLHRHRHQHRGGKGRAGAVGRYQPMVLDFDVVIAFYLDSTARIDQYLAESERDFEPKGISLKDIHPEGRERFQLQQAALAGSRM